MDIATIINLLAIGNGISAIIFLIFIRNYTKKNTALYYFTCGKILQSIAWIILIIFRSNVSPTTMLIVNAFQYIGLTIEVLGFTHVFNKNREKTLKIWLIICAIFLVGYALVASNVIARVALTSCLYFGLYTFMFTSLALTKGHSKTQHIAGWLALTFALIHLSRGLFSLFYNTELLVYNTELIQIITGYIYIIITFTFPIFLLLIIIEKDNTELNELNTAKNKLFRIIGHDLKSPIVQLTYMAELIELKEGKMEATELEKLGLTIKESSLRTSKLLDDLLNWAQSESNTMSIKPEAIKIIENIFENSELLKGKLKEKNILIKQNISESHIIFCDKNMLNTILRNLISNAIKFSHENSSIEISSKCDEKSCTISIKDHGVGIEEKNINKLFRIGSDFSTLGTNNEKGTGIGLALCKEFVEKSGGKIGLKSVINKGTTFYFSLPIFKPED